MCSILENYIQFTHECLNNEHRDHLIQKGLTSKQINEFMIGFHPLSGINILTDDELIELGVILPQNQKNFSYFFDSFVIPLYLNNELISVMAYKPEGNPQYAFLKGVQKPVTGNIGTKTVVLTDYFDMITMQNAGFDCVSILGDTISQFQLDLLKDKCCNKYYLSYFNDKSVKHALKSYSKLNLEYKSGELSSNYIAAPNEFKNKIQSLIAQSDLLDDDSSSVHLSQLEIYENIMLNVVKLIVSTENEAFVIYKDNGKTLHDKVRSANFKNFVRNYIFNNFKKIERNETINLAIEQIEATAFQKSKVEVFNRTALNNQKFYYDLACNDGDIIEIDETGYRIIKNPEILFQRFPHMLPQLIDDTGNIDILFDIIMLPTDSQKLLLKVALVYCLIYNLPKPIIYVQGGKGAAKTESCKILKMLVDPSISPVLSQPKNQDDLQLQMYNNYMPCYDNIHSLSSEFIKMLCMVATGQAFEKRSLYTNSDTVIFRCVRSVIINSINRLDTAYPDLQDRMILITLERIPENQRREQSEVWKHFESVRGKIFTGMLDILSKAIAIKKTLKLPELSRMADFNAWGEAISMAMGNEQGVFTKVYKENMAVANSEILSNNSVANVITLFMINKSLWGGTATTLLSELKLIAKENQIDIRENGWPKSPAKLSQRINEIKSNLQDIGIYITNTRLEGMDAVRRPLTIKNINFTENKEIQAN